MFWDPNLYDTKHSFVWERGAELIDLLAPAAGERILDLGCGTGHLTAKIAAFDSETIGIDSSPAMIAEASRNYPALHFEVADARDFWFDRPFDAIFSNAALHWITEPERVVESVHEALKPGGRFVAEFGGKGNVQALVQAFYDSLQLLGRASTEVKNPWYFPGIAEYSSLLESHGFEVVFATLFDRPTPLDQGQEGMRNWITMFAGAFCAAIPPERRDAFVRRVEQLLQPSLFRDGGWYVDYRRLRIVARKI